MLNALIDHSVITFVTIIILGSLDFWTVKNISGRKLVGLRWWNDFTVDGNEVWIFESHPSASYRPNQFNSSVFWGA